MASTRMAQPMRGITSQLGRLSLRQDAVPKALSTSFARSISTSTPPKAAVSSVTTSVDGFVPVKPLHEQTVQATIHMFPSLEPLRLETYPANHLYLPTRRDILHRAVVYEGDSTRLGTASAKTRYEVHGSAHKIRPQKGSGRARLGDKKSPMLRGGGVSHGPKPRDFSSGLPRKVYDLAWRTALSYRFRKGELIIVDNAIEIESPSQRLLKHIFDLHDRERGRGRSLLVTLESRPLIEQALEKMDRRRQALTWEEVDVKDMLELSRVIIERSALKNILTSHQEDLTHISHRPGAGIIKSAPPTDLESIPGWAEFRVLASAPSTQRAALRADTYEAVAYTRWQQAESLPESSPERIQLTISAYELLAEAKDLRREQLPTFEYLRHKFDQDENYASGLKDPIAANAAAVEAGISQVAFHDAVAQHHELHAQAAEHRRDALQWQGRDEEAEYLEEEAGNARALLAEAKVEVCRARKELAEARENVCTDMGDAEGARKYQEEAEAVQVEWDMARLELEGGDLGAVVEEDPTPEAQGEKK